MRTAGVQAGVFSLDGGRRLPISFFTMRLCGENLVLGLRL
jgi:hypothetical protein